MLASKILRSGAGTPLVFFHGLFGTSSDWEPLVSFLPPCHCIGFDLPGHGKSPFIENFTIPLPSFHLIGYSMGGRIAMQYANQHPEQIASLTLLSTHPGLKTEAEKQKRLQEDQKWAEMLFTFPIEEFFKIWYDQPLFKTFTPDFEMRRKQNIPALAQALLHFSLGYQPYFELDHVLVGEHDEKFRTLFQNPIIIPHASHAIHLENPKETARMLQERIFS